MQSENAESYIGKLSGEYSGYTVNVINSEKETKAMQTMYSSLITIVAFLLFVITVLIILLILYVIIRSMTSSLKTDFGIYKAMGFTSRQLITQTVGSITPDWPCELTSVFCHTPLLLRINWCKPNDSLAKREK